MDYLRLNLMDLWMVNWEGINVDFGGYFNSTSGIEV